MKILTTTQESCHVDSCSRSAEPSSHVVQAPSRGGLRHRSDLDTYESVCMALILTALLWCPRRDPNQGFRVPKQLRRCPVKNNNILSHRRSHVSGAVSISKASRRASRDEICGAGARHGRSDGRTLQDMGVRTIRERCPNREIGPLDAARESAKVLCSGSRLKRESSSGAVFIFSPATSPGQHDRRVLRPSPHPHAGAAPHSGTYRAKERLPLRSNGQQ